MKKTLSRLEPRHCPDGFGQRLQFLVILVMMVAVPVLGAGADEIVFGPNVRVDDSGSDSSGQSYVAMDVAVNGDIYAVWQDGRGPDGDPNIYFAKSTDRGAIFDPNVCVNDTGSSVISQSNPDIAAAANGEIYVVWQDKRNGNMDIYFAKSTDNGATFGPNIRVDDTGAGTNWQTQPAITTDSNSNIYVVWSDRRNGDPDIYFAKSMDNGATFSANIRVDDGSSGAKRAPAIAVDASGNIYVAWQDWYNGVGEIVFAKSADGGVTFSANVLVNDPWLVSHEIPSIVVDNTSGNIYITWSDSRLANPDIWFSRSTNGGASFEEDVRVDDDDTGHGQYAPTITVSAEGDIYIVWDDLRNNSTSSWDIYFARSTTAGVSFEPNLRVDDTDSVSVEQRYPSMATDVDGQVYVVWHDDRNADLNYDIYFARSVYQINMAEMPWYQNIGPYSSTGAAVSQMLLNYIRTGAGEPTLTQDQIYEYARDPLAYDGTELDADQVDKALGYFDPYDYLVSNWWDRYDGTPDGNRYQGYNFEVHTYPPNQFDEYIRDICDWMAYQVKQWPGDAPLVAYPNTPAAVPIFGDTEGYSHWVAIKGLVTNESPNNGSDFTIFGLWMKDPQIDGIGQDTYKTASECESSYFKPLNTADAYDGLFLQVAEPPAEISAALALIPVPEPDLASLEFIGVEAEEQLQQAAGAMVMLEGSSSQSGYGENPPARKQSWRDLVDPYLLADQQAVLAFEGARMGRPILVRRLDAEAADYYLVPFGRGGRRRFMASGVIILDAAEGFFKEASWSETAEKYLKVDKRKAIQLVRRHLLTNRPRRPRKQLLQSLYQLHYVQPELVWQSGGYSSSPYQPWWQVELNGQLFCITQQGELISQK